MRIAALISQPLRANYCQAYLNQCESAVILTSDPSVFDEFDMGDDTQILNVSPPPDLVPSKQLARSRVFRAIVKRARTGSALGRWMERTARRVAWRLRFADRIILLARRRRRASAHPTDRQASAMYQALLAEAESRPFEAVVVFDVFDLPVAMQFADDHGLDVLVR